MPLNQFWKKPQSTASEETESLLPGAVVTHGSIQRQPSTNVPVSKRGAPYEVPGYPSLKSHSRYPSVILTGQQKETLRSRVDTLTKQLIHMSHLYTDTRPLGNDLPDHELAGMINVFTWRDGRPPWLDKNSKLLSGSHLHHDFSVPSFKTCPTQWSCRKATFGSTDLSALTGTLLKDVRSNNRPGLETRQTSLLYIAHQLQKMKEEGRYGEMACKIPEWSRTMTDCSARAFSARLLSRSAQTDASQDLERHTLGDGPIFVADSQGS